MRREASNTFAIGRERRQSINTEINAVVADPDIRVEPISMTPAKFGKFMVGGTEKWAKVIRAAGIKAE